MARVTSMHTSIIGFSTASAGKDNFYAQDPQRGKRIEPPFSPAQLADVDAAVALAEKAFAEYSNCSGEVKGKFLRQIASNIQKIEGEIVERAALETALPPARLKSETARTVG